MVWRLRASLQDRPGGLVRIADACGRSGVNILALDVLPGADERVTDELVLHTPAGWTEDAVRSMCLEAGIDDAEVRPCSVNALEDLPVRYLRAVTELISRPGSIEEDLPALLGRLLDAAEADEADADAADLRERMTLEDGDGPPVRLARSHRFTDTEWARAAELRRVAAALQAMRSDEQRAPEPDSFQEQLTSVSLREGSLLDFDLVRLLHARCSSETLRRRYHSAPGALTTRLARAVLEPDEGFSLLLCAQDRGRDCVVGMGVLVVHDQVAEAALLVEDRWQRHGFGSRIMREIAVRAGTAGLTEITLLAQPGNSAAVARTLARAALTSRTDTVDGLTRFRVPVQQLTLRRGSRKQPSMGAITAPLVGLLHRRQELRDAVAAADLIDSAIRDSA